MEKSVGWSVGSEGDKHGRNGKTQRMASTKISSKYLTVYRCIFRNGVVFTCQMSTALKVTAAQIAGYPKWNLLLENPLVWKDTYFWKSLRDSDRSVVRLEESQKTERNKVEIVFKN